MVQLFLNLEKIKTLINIKFRIKEIVNDFFYKNIRNIEKKVAE